MDLAPRTLDVAWVPVGDLRPHPDNPRLNEDAVAPVAASIRRFGWQQPIVARRDGQIVAGHTRWKAARDLKLEQVPVLWFDGDDVEAEAYLIADNRTHDFAAWDEAALARLLEHLRATSSLEGVGYSEAEAAKIIAEHEAALRAASGEVDDPGPQEPPETPVTRTGDLWILGDHRLLCGDSTNAVSFEKALLNCAAPRVVWTDPPYGVSYVGKTKDAMTIENDTLAGDGLSNLLTMSFTPLLGMCAPPGCVWYVAAPSGPQFYFFAKSLLDLGLWRQTLAWVKNAMVLGHSDFHYRHESIFYGWKEGPHRAPPDRRQTTVLEFDKPSASRDHPTTKPFDLVAYCLRMSGAAGEVVIDPFCGSGTTLLAAHGSGMRGVGIELDPSYVDAAVLRWQIATGLNATLDGDGRSFEEIAKERSEA